MTPPCRPLQMGFQGVGCVCLKGGCRSRRRCGGRFRILPPQNLGSKGSRQRQGYAFRQGMYLLVYFRKISTRHTWGFRGTTPIKACKVCYGGGEASQKTSKPFCAGMIHFIIFFYLFLTLFLTQVCLPMVRRCPVEVSRALYLSTTAAGSAFDPGSKGASTSMPVLRRLSAVFERRSKQTGKFLAGPLLASCCFALVEVRRGDMIVAFFLTRRRLFHADYVVCRAITCGAIRTAFVLGRTVFH